MEKIDFIIPWVDSSDPKWLAEKNRYISKKDELNNPIIRYRDMNVLKYWFRAVEKFTPWVNKIHFVTYGHIPSWLNTKNPKLNIVKHTDYIPKQYLPTFSSHVIELNFHRIKGLSDKFVYFNDDIFIIKETEPSYFFKKGLPRDIWREDIYPINKIDDNIFLHTLLNNRIVMSRNFSKREVFQKNFRKIINPIYGRKNLGFILLSKWPFIAEYCDYHTASPFLKKTYEEVWEKEFDFLNNTCTHKFRNVEDVNQGVMQLWQVFSGNYTPRSYKNYGKYFRLLNNNEELFDCMDRGSYNIICINDTNTNIDYERVTKELAQHFERLLPEKSSFEK